jgi:3-oxoacyl-[acyl-carrier protein] reductase
MSGRYVLITGATRGLGRSMAEHYLAQGDTVIGCGRSPSTLTHDRYTHTCLDVSDEAAVNALFASVRERQGRLDVLINNAGIGSMNLVALMPVAAARRMVETNVLGTFLFTQRGIRLLRRAEHPRIVNVTTVAVPLRLQGEAVYAASKSAVETFTRVTAHELGQWGITCNAVGPCPVRTDLTRNVPEAAMSRLLARQAMPRWAEPADVVNVVDFFLRPDSGLVTGQVVYLGGIS